MGRRCAWGKRRRSRGTSRRGSDWTAATTSARARRSTPSTPFTFPTMRNNGVTHEGEHYAAGALRDAPAGLRDDAKPTTYRAMRRVNDYSVAERSIATLGHFEEILTRSETGVARRDRGAVVRRRRAVRRAVGALDGYGLLVCWTFGALEAVPHAGLGRAVRVRSIQTFFTHLPLSTFDRIPFQLTGETFFDIGISGPQASRARRFPRRAEAFPGGGEVPRRRVVRGQDAAIRTAGV